MYEKGRRFDATSSLSIEMIVESIKRDIKVELPDVKALVELADGHKGAFIQITVTDLQINPINARYVRDMYSRSGVYLTYKETKEDWINGDGVMVLEVIKDIADAYNHEDPRLVRFHGNIAYQYRLLQRKTRALLEAA